jgi:hypothetical protein
VYEYSIEGVSPDVEACHKRETLSLPVVPKLGHGTPSMPDRLTYIFTDKTETISFGGEHEPKRSDGIGGRRIGRLLYIRDQRKGE